MSKGDCLLERLLFSSFVTQSSGERLKIESFTIKKLKINLFLWYKIEKLS